jgi:hypothetical protein
MKVVDANDSNIYASQTSLSAFRRGASWADAAAGVGLVNTILRPESPSGSLGHGPNFDGIYSAASQHPAGVNVAMANGAVHTLPRSLNVGNSSSPTVTIEQLAQGNIPSPYGLWGAMGTIAAEDDATLPW